MASSARMSSLHPAKLPARGGFTSRQDPSRKLVRLSRELEEAIHLVMKYVAHATGAEPRQEDLAAVLKSYFTLDEVTNQISYLRKKPPESAGAEACSGPQRPSMRINMIAAARTNCLARAGFFIRPIADAIGEIRKHAGSMLGVVPSDASIALSLRSSFILSELKNQIVYARSQLRGQDA
jgi:hypothetical protein